MVFRGLINNVKIICKFYACAFMYMYIGTDTHNFSLSSFRIEGTAMQRLKGKSILGLRTCKGLQCGMLELRGGMGEAFLGMLKKMKLQG